MRPINRLLDRIFLYPSGRLKEERFIWGHLVEHNASNGRFAAPVED